MLKQTKSLLTVSGICHSRSAWIRRWVGVGVVAAALLISQSSTEAFPPAGFDTFDSVAAVTIVLTGIATLQVEAAGPGIALRLDPRVGTGGLTEVPTELVALRLSGTTPLGPITIRESPTRRSPGLITEQQPGTDFPADSFFDVFVEIETAAGTFHNEDPIRLSAVINAIPPLHEQYNPPAVLGVPLFDPGGNPVGVITHASHFVGEKPSFSVAAGGPSPFDPADIFNVPTVVGLTAASLGLGPGDDVDALSYGTDYLDQPIKQIFFSVDPAAAGVLGSGVNNEATKVPNEAHGDEFRGVPEPAPIVGTTNVREIDENGDDFPASFPLLISDDVDALTQPATGFVDTDGNGTPDRPVFFSLTPTSPTLAAIGAGPADLLQTVGGGPPTVFATAAVLGLQAGDDINALCVDTVNLGPITIILFSLAPGSPTLTTFSANPSDLIFAAPLFVGVRGTNLGLLASDNLNAVKCVEPISEVMVLSLATNGATFTTDQTLTVSAAALSPGTAGFRPPSGGAVQGAAIVRQLPVLVDFYFGVALPDGVNCLFFTDLIFNFTIVPCSDPTMFVPILAGVDADTPFEFVQSTFFTHLFTGTEPPGTYAFFLAAVRSNSLADGTVDPGDIVTLTTIPFTFTP